MYQAALIPWTLNYTRVVILGFGLHVCLKKQRRVEAEDPLIIRVSATVNDAPTTYEGLEHGSRYSGFEYLHQQTRPFQLLPLLSEQPGYLHCVLLRLFTASKFTTKFARSLTSMISLVSSSPVRRSLAARAT